MKTTVQRRCELLVENRQLVSKASVLESSLLRAVAAASYTEKDMSADVDQLKDCIKLLKKKQGAFSYLRGNTMLIIASRMTLSGNPEGYLDDVIEVYKVFQKGKFFGSYYRVLASMSICDAGRSAQAEEIIEKTNALLKEMSKSHPWLTNEEDTSFAVLLAMTDKSIDEILTELEESYQYIKKNFSFHDNAAYSLSQVLTTLDGSYDQKGDKALEIYNAFKEAGSKYGKNYELASIGALVNTDMNTEDLVSEVIEVAEFLKGKKGFGALEMDRYTRLMLGTMIVSGIYSNEKASLSASVTSGALATVIAEQLCMYVAIMAASTSVAVSSSN
jgi:hypothetical protein